MLKFQSLVVLLVTYSFTFDLFVHHVGTRIQYRYQTIILVNLSHSSIDRKTKTRANRTIKEKTKEKRKGIWKNTTDIFVSSLRTNYQSRPVPSGPSSQATPFHCLFLSRCLSRHPNHSVHDRQTQRTCLATKSKLHAHKGKNEDTKTKEYSTQKGTGN